MEDGLKEQRVQMESCVDTQALTDEISFQNDSKQECAKNYSMNMIIPLRGESSFRPQMRSESLWTCTDTRETS